MQPTPDSQKIGKRFREERERLGLTMQYVSAAAETTRQRLSRIEKGEWHPDAPLLALMSKLGADVEYILTGQRSVKLDLTQLATAARALAESRHPLAGDPKQWSDMPEEHAPIAAAVILSMALPLYQAQTGITLAEYCRAVIRQVHPAGIKARAAELYEAAK